MWSIYKESLLQDRKQRSATDTYAHLLKEKISYVELIINLYIFIYIFIFLVFSLSHLFGLCVSVSLTLSHACSDLFWFFFFSRSPFMDLYNVTKVTDLKLQSPKKKRKKKEKLERAVFFAHRHWQLQHRGHCLRCGGISSKRRWWRLLARGALLQVEALQSDV